MMLIAKTPSTLQHPGGEALEFGDERGKLVRLRNCFKILTLIPSTFYLLLIKVSNNFHNRRQLYIVFPSNKF